MRLTVVGQQNDTSERDDDYVNLTTNHNGGEINFLFVKQSNSEKKK